MEKNTLAVFFGVVGVVSLLAMTRSRPKKEVDYREYEIPLPDSVVALLNAARLCTLATNHEGPHLSLMNFTYFREDEVLILCTKRKTKKFAQISGNAEVAVLINDFPLLRADNGIPGSAATGTSTGSITLNGTAEALRDSDPLAVKYRAVHLANNEQYAHFIEGEDIAVIVIRFDAARICDFKDQVKHWQR